MEVKPPTEGPLANRTRFILLILVVLCLMINWANILTFNFTVVYYLHAIVATVLFTTFYACYRNRPNTHPFVNDLEKSKIARGRDSLDAEAEKHVPYRSIVKSPAVWAVFIGGIGNFVAINLIYQFTPIYLHEVQGYEVVNTGFLAAVPPLAEGIMKELSGLSNDRIPKSVMGETVKTRVYNSIAFLSMAAFLIVLGFVPQGYGKLAFLLLSAGACLLGFNTGGFYKSGSIIAGPYAPFVLGQVSTAMTLTMLIVPVVVNALTPHHTDPGEWAHAFWANAAIIIACNTFYVCFARGELEPWARADHIQSRIRIRVADGRRQPQQQQQ